MAICSKCGGALTYGEPHECAGRDTAKMWLWIALAVGAALGAPGGYAYGQSVIARACGLPGAGNLCGITDALAQPVYVMIGAAMGACATAIIATFTLRYRSR